LAHRRILVVDDNPDIADAIGMLLEALGAETTVVYRGADALEALPSFRPEVIVADIGMPVMDGYELARQVRARQVSRQPVLVAVTGWGADEDQRRVREAGFDHHLIKPVGAAQLKAALCAEPVEAPKGPLTYPSGPR
jgi:CheY-like chemotaxis protein